MGAVCVSRDNHQTQEAPRSNVPPDERLYVVTSFFLPVFSKTRVDLYKQFERHMRIFPHVELWTIECVLTGNGYYVTQSANPHNVQVRCAQPLWIKENLLNILLKRLPKHAKYVAWIDADVYFTNKNWAVQAVNQLKSVDIVQLFQDSDFIGKDGQVQYSAKSLMYYAQTNLPMVEEFNKREDTYPHPGYAWAANMSYLNQIGKLFEYNIVGSGDKMMAYATLGKWEFGLQPGFKLQQSFMNECRRWSEHAIPQRGYGFVKGRLVHNYHGERGDRNYVNRWQLFEKYRFDPLRDIYHNEHGVIQLADHQRDLQEEIRQYFVDRKDHLAKVVEVKKKQLPKKEPKKVVSSGGGGGIRNNNTNNSNWHPDPYRPHPSPSPYDPHPHPDPRPHPHPHPRPRSRSRSRSHSGDRHHHHDHHNHHEREHHPHHHDNNDNNHHDHSHHDHGHHDHGHHDNSNGHQDSGGQHHGNGWY